MSKKKIALINQHTAYLFIDIANSFAKEYDEVVLLAGVVHPLGTKLNKNIKVQKIVPYKITNTFSRISTWLIGFFQVVFLLALKYRKYEVFAYSNPPLLMFLPFFIRRKMSHLIVDVYPDAFISASIIKSEKSIAFRVWASLSRLALKRFHKVFTITNGMAKKVSRYLNGASVPVIQLWANSSIGYADIERHENKFLTHYGFSKYHFNVVYSGNLGKGHNVEYLVDVANAMKNNKKITFIIAGNGYKRDFIEQKIKKYDLKNCHLLGYLEEELFTYLLAATDIGVVTIDDPMADVSIPSKTFNLMGAGKPVICFGSTRSELGKLVKENELGEIYNDNYLTPCTNFIERLFNDSQEYLKYAKNSRKASLKYTSDNANKFVLSHQANNC